MVVGILDGISAMPRRNLVLLLLAVIVSFVCYRQADSAHRSRYGRMFDTFVEVMAQIDQKYVDPVEDRELFEAAMEGMVRHLDPYSDFIGPEESKELNEQLSQKFGGIGVEVSFDRETGMLMVLSPLVGTPAYENGIVAGDLILAIDGESTEGFNMEDAFKRLRGAMGTTVRLKVRHRGEKEPLDISITRAEINVDTVLGDSRKPDGHWSFSLAADPRLGYIRITQFGKKTAEELKAALDELSKQPLDGLILDLRDNAGGLLDAAVETCDLFVPPGEIVTTHGRDPMHERVFQASGNGKYQGLPMVVLVNHHSASASEIVAACLQDHARAVVVGVRTWGKGTVQNLIPVEGGRSTLKLTTANYWRPSNQNIHRRRDAKETDAWGVMPDKGFEVSLTDEQRVAVVRQRRQRDVVRPAGAAASGDEAGEESSQPVIDLQLQKAIEHLRKDRMR